MSAKDDKHFSAAEKQRTPLSSEVDPKEVAAKAKQTVFRHAVEVKNSSLKR